MRCEREQEFGSRNDESVSESVRCSVLRQNANERSKDCSDD